MYQVIAAGVYSNISFSIMCWVFRQIFRIYYCDILQVLETLVSKWN